jgi:two-component system CheB/CheR fusion protein
MLSSRSNPFRSLLPLGAVTAAFLVVNLLHPGISEEVAWMLAFACGLAISILGEIYVRRSIAIALRADEAVRRHGEAVERERAAGHDRDFISAVIQAVHSLVIVVDRTGDIVWFNRACEETSGFSADEVRGRKLWDVLLPEEERSVSVDRLDAIISGGSTEPRLTRWKRRDGEIRHINFSTGIIRDDSGAVEYMIATGIDVTETNQIQQALRKSEERFNLVVRATNDIVWDWDLWSGEVWWNEGLVRSFGYSEDQLASNLEWWTGRIHPDDRARVEGSISRAIETRQQQWVEEYRFLTADGSYAYILDNGYLLVDTNDMPIRMIGVMMDFTERKRAEEEILRKEQLTRSILHSLLVHIAVLDGDGRIVAVNKSWEEFGRAQDRSRPEIGVNYLQKCSEAAEQGSKAARDAFDGITEVINGRLAQFSMVYSTTLPNETRWFMMNVTALQGGGGAVTSHHDITERRMAEDALREMNVVLEGKVEERTRDIRSMIGQLEQANQVQKRFIADASHELRTPLTIVQAELDLLLAGREIDPGTRDALARIAGESRRLAYLANDLLLLAKGDANQFGASRIARIDELVVDCISQLKTLAANKEILWRIDADEPLEVSCNVPSLSRAVTNLMENAIKYSPHGATVILALRKAEDRVVIEISDSGPGIRSEDLPRIFDRFYRGDLARSAGGFGLGLSIVRSIVEAHNGSVTIESEPGSGTTARIMLPVVTDLAEV